MSFDDEHLLMMEKEQNNTYTHAFKHTHAHNTVKSEKYSTANPKNPHKSTAQLKCKKRLFTRT